MPTIRNNFRPRRIPRQFMSLIPEWEDDYRHGSGEFEEENADDSHDEGEYCQVVDEFGCVAIENFFPGGTGNDSITDNKWRWTRVEKETDPSIASDVRTRATVWGKIQQVKAEQSKYGVSHLYEREWQECATRASKLNAATSPIKAITEAEPQTIMVNGDSVRSSSIAACTFSVVQLNALAEGLSSSPSAQRPFQVDSNDCNIRQERSGAFGGFTALPFPEQTMDFSMRRWRLVELILNTMSKYDQNEVELDEDSELFDIIALEEVDRYNGFFAPILRLFGYESLFVPKTRSPCVRMGWYSDGACLAWKKSVFQLLWEHRGEYKVGNQVFILAALRHKATGRVLIVAVTHLKAQKGSENESMRLLQVQELLESIDKAAAFVQTRGHEDPPVLILGDFNAEPPSLVVAAAERTERATSSVRCVLDYEFSYSKRSGSTSEPIKLSSAYPINPPPPDFYTTFKIRGSETARRIIDYIFYSSQLTCEATLKVPSERELEPSKLPGLRHPSDHMLIAAKLRL